MWVIADTPRPEGVCSVYVYVPLKKKLARIKALFYRPQELPNLLHKLQENQPETQAE